MLSIAVPSRDRLDIPAAMPARIKVARLIGGSPEIVALQGQIDRAARSDAKVLIMGESGVGKEIVARNTHLRSARASKLFAPVNCAGLSETLLESELFGPRSVRISTTVSTSSESWSRRYATIARTYRRWSSTS